MRILASLLLAVGLTAAAPPPQQTLVDVAGPNGPLKGTMLTPPIARPPVVLMIPGSGPTDRDGNSPMGVKAAPLRLLAEGLAAQGIATIRVDKRGMFASAAAVPNANAVTIDDYVTDVHAWVASIRQRTGAPCVWLLGHSEGGLVALRASQSPAGICGLVLVATPGRPLGTILRDQLKANPANAPILNRANMAISEFEAGRHVDVSKLGPVLAGLFKPSVQSFLIAEMAANPATLIAAYHAPALILQGEKDIQVSVEDAELLKQAKPDATMDLLPNTNHMLKTVVSDDRTANIATYADPALPLAPGVVPAVAQFIKAAG